MSWSASGYWANLEGVIVVSPESAEKLDAENGSRAQFESIRDYIGELCQRVEKEAGDRVRWQASGHVAPADGNGESTLSISVGSNYRED